MKKVIFSAAILLVFLAGLSILLYPYISSYINSLRQTRVVAQYYSDLETLNEEDFTKLLDEARAYNERLAGNHNRYTLSDDEMEEYLGLLNPFGNGIMGTLEIDKIGVLLPIYHGTNEGVLRIGAGHLEGTSLPVGGPGTHTVITGHRGLPSAMLLTELDKMEIGDIFTLHVLGDVLTYKVDQILVVEPDQMDALAIENGKDYCTLVTCTPYGVNSHRMLVRGSRVDDTGAGENVTAEMQGHPDTGDGRVASVPAAGLLLIIPAILVAIYLIISIKKLHGRRRTR